MVKVQLLRVLCFLPLCTKICARLCVDDISRYCLGSKPTQVVQNYIFVTILGCESHLGTKVCQKAVDFMHRCI